MTGALETALAYIDRGWSLVPVGYREKGPRLRGWQKLRITAETASQYFNGGKQNIGVILGPASGGLTDVDFDCPEALAIGSRFLPAGAEAIFGRASSRASHYLFMTDLASTEGKTVITFDDPMRSGKEARLLEIRIGGAGAGAQTIVPPSTHKDTGEEICWESDGAPPQIDGAVLKRAVSLAAFGCLILRYMTGARHDAFLTLGGFLARCGFTPANVKLIASAIVDGGKLERDHIGHAVDACKAHHDGKNSYGYPKLAEIFGDKVAGKCAEWLGFRPDVGMPSLAAHTWSEPRPIESTLPPVMPFDPDLLPDPLRDYVIDVAERQQARLTSWPWRACARLRHSWVTASAFCPSASMTGKLFPTCGARSLAGRQR